MKKLDKCDLLFLQAIRSALRDEQWEMKSPLSYDEWNSIYEKSKKQTVVGLLYDGITTLPKQYLPPKKILLELFMVSNQIEKQNIHLNKSLIEVVSKYREAGIAPVLLKGQGLAQYYRNPLKRQSGDIDLYFFENYEQANQVAATWDYVNFHPDTTYHRAFDYKDVEVENHRVYVDFYSTQNKKIWGKIAKLVPLTGSEKLSFEKFSVDVPSPQMNVLYVFLHFMHHFLQIGVGLRQVCDWTCLWEEKHEDIDKKLFLECVRLLKLERSMTALTYIVTNYLGLPKEYIPLDATTNQAKNDGEFMLRDILDMGNFGHGSDIAQGFVRNHHWHNLKSYGKAFIRQMFLYRFYPAEVRSYPWVWLKSKIML